MSKILALSNIELRKNLKFYSIYCATILVSIIAVNGYYIYMSATTYNLTEMYRNQIGGVFYGAMILEGNMVIHLLLSLGVMGAILYTAAIWLKDWNGSHKNIYTYMMIPGNKMKIYAAKMMNSLFFVYMVMVCETIALFISKLIFNATFASKCNLIDSSFNSDLSFASDTLFVCSATGFMILMTNCYTTFNETTKQVVYNAGQSFTTEQIGPQYTIAGINTLIPGFGGAFVTIALFFFVFTTLMAYYYIAEVNLTYIIKKITGGKSSKIAQYLLVFVFLGMIAFGAVKSAELAWTMGDIGVGMMAWLNIIAILILSNPVMKCFKDYERQLKAGIPTTEITFDPINLGIKGATFWEEKCSNTNK